MAYADDMGLVAKTMKNLKTITSTLIEENEKIQYREQYKLLKSKRFPIIGSGN